MEVNGELSLCRFYTCFLKHTCDKGKGTVRSPRFIACLTNVWPHSMHRATSIYPKRIFLSHFTCISRLVKRLLQGSSSVAPDYVCEAHWCKYGLEVLYVCTLKGCSIQLYFKRIISSSSRSLHFKTQVYRVFSFCMGSSELQGWVIQIQHFRTASNIVQHKWHDGSLTFFQKPK